MGADSALFSRSFPSVFQASFKRPSRAFGGAQSVVAGLVRQLQSSLCMTTPAKWILHATDFSDGSDEALERAIELAKQTGANLELVYVLEPGLDDSLFGFTIYGSDRGGLVAHLDRQLSARADRATKVGVLSRTTILEGSAAAEIVEHARLGGATLIVVGTHGRTGLAHAFLGSVAERIVQKSVCPVLTVPFSRKAA